jgi:NTP pyrophosphatase (non-canonical NTP hydrolase)
MDLEELSERSWELSRELGYMEPADRFAALVEEVGELAHGLLVQREVKATTESEDLEIAFAGVLFELLVLAREHDVDLVRGYARGVALLEGRLPTKHSTG